jgi:hypothetical protein
MAYQNWNNLLGFIKSKLGASVNFLEFSDEDIVNHIKEQTLPSFSQFHPLRGWRLIDASHRIPADSITEFNNETYRLPVDITTRQIVGVRQIYHTPDRILTQMFSIGRHTLFADPRDVVMTNTFSDMIAFLQPVQSFHFEPPDIIRLSLEIETQGVILEINFVHDKLETIPVDTYNSYFKKMALKDICENLIAVRSKYENMQSQFGEINLNIQYLENLKQKLEEELREEEQWTPPDILIKFF